LTRLLHKHRPSVVRIEACLLAGWVRDLCAELGVPDLVVGTTSKAWKFKHLKRKADRDDALRLAELYLLGKFPRVEIPEKELREKRGLIETRQKLGGRRVASAGRRGWKGSVPQISPHRAPTGGSFPPPGPPASLSLLPERQED